MKYSLSVLRCSSRRCDLACRSMLIAYLLSGCGSDGSGITDATFLVDSSPSDARGPDAYVDSLGLWDADVDAPWVADAGEDAWSVDVAVDAYEVDAEVDAAWHPDADIDAAWHPDADIDANWQPDAEVDAVWRPDAEIDAAVDAEPADAFIDCSAAFGGVVTLANTFSGAEDFTFDDTGHLVSEHGNNLTKQTKTGPIQIVVPNIGGATGIRHLASGDIVYAKKSAGQLIRLDKTTGAPTVLQNNLSSPNGVEVDLDGYVYVSELGSGRVQRIDPDGVVAPEIIATGITGANGISFSPDYNTLYVTSFGGGKVWALARNGASWDLSQFGSAGPGLTLVDGIAVDACGNVYVTVFSHGKILRFDPGGGTASLVAQVGSSYPANLHWGTGIGGWDDHKLYVIARSPRHVFELDVGIPEKVRVFP